MENLTNEQIAQVCHEANKGYCDSIGDTSQKTWAEAPEWQRQSAIEGVSKALAGATPEQLHESWTEAKLRDGWKFGAVKDSDAKTHPCLVPYADLPAEQRRKDALFANVVAALRS